VKITELPTPQVLIERRRLEANLDRMQSAATARKIRLRPHSKTHKSPVIARMQLGRGAAGICCAKVGEAEVFAAEGIPDIRLPYPVSPFNASRVRTLLEVAAISIVVDHPAVAREWSRVMHGSGATLDVLVKVDVGYHRCGIDPDVPAATDLVVELASLPGLRLRGLLSHAGHGYLASSTGELQAIAIKEVEVLLALAARARARGVGIDEISVGATPTARFSLEQPGVTELRPGNYAYFDRTQVSLGAARRDDCALSVMATVVSRPARDRLVLDCGSKTLSSDAARGFGRPSGFGDVYPDLEGSEPDERLLVARLSEEHAVVTVKEGDTPLQPGHRVRVLPNHACVVSNLVDHVHLVDGLTIEDTLPVAARGRIS